MSGVSRAMAASKLGLTASRVAVTLLLASGMMSLLTVSATAQGAVVSSITQTACSIYETVHAVVFVITLLLVVVGSVIYAGGYILPGNLKGAAHGYGMGMVVGSIVGTLLALSAPFILQAVTGNSAVGGMCAGYAPL